MRVAIIYRPKNPAPFDALPMLMEALGQWVETYSTRVATMEFFAIGGGLVLADLADSVELHRLVVDNPFTPFMDVEVMPIVEPSTAMATWAEFASTIAGSGQPGA